MRHGSRRVLTIGHRSRWAWSTTVFAGAMALASAAWACVITTGSVTTFTGPQTIGGVPATLTASPVSAGVGGDTISAQSVDLPDPGLSPLQTHYGTSGDCNIGNAGVVANTAEYGACIITSGEFGAATTNVWTLRYQTLAQFAKIIPGNVIPGEMPCHIYGWEVDATVAPTGTIGSRTLAGSGFVPTGAEAGPAFVCFRLGSTGDDIVYNNASSVGGGPYVTPPAIYTKLTSGTGCTKIFPDPCP